MRRGRDAAALLAYAGWPNAAALIGIELLAAALPLGIIAIIGVLVGRVAGDEAVAGPLMVLSVLLLLQQLLGPFRGALAYSVTRRVDGALRARVMEAANRSSGIALLEDPETVDRLALAGGVIDPHWHASPGGAATACVLLAARYLQVAGAVVLLARVSLAVASGLTAAVLLVYRQSRRWNRVRIKATRGAHPAGRRSRYTSGLANTPGPAKETRLFGLLEWLVARFRDQWHIAVSPRLDAARWSNTRIAMLTLSLTPVAAIAFVVVGRSGLDGDLDARGLAIALQAAIVIVSLLDQRGDELYLYDFGLESLQALREVEATVADEPVRGGRAASGLPRDAIRFENVSFAYPGGTPVFDGLDLTIPAGSSLAIVGNNGAGKTTLVKLLAGLYVPAGGTISVDGEPLQAFDLASWRERLAVIFQDFVRYELPASDNVGFGGCRLGRDVEALARAAARAGAATVVGRLPGGWDTPLSRQYAGGADLSGGEWQRVALARALFAVEAGAGVLVLDEPTANLDVRAEAELFDEFIELTRGLTTILISHRFSTVRRADRIVVLEAGRVVEDGTHDQLVSAGGRYAQMFNLQAARFHG